MKLTKLYRRGGQQRIIVQTERGEVEISGDDVKERVMLFREAMGRMPSEEEMRTIIAKLVRDTLSKRRTPLLIDLTGLVGVELGEVDGE